MRVTADTNVLVRAIMDDDLQQSLLARRELEAAELVAVTLPALCELVWVLARGYKVESSGIADVIRLLMNSANVALHRPAAEAGLAVLESGGDFADGVIAFEGRQLGAEVFLTFDKAAAQRIAAQGGSVRLPS